MYHLTWALQFLTLLLANMGFIILGGKALKVTRIDEYLMVKKLMGFFFLTGKIKLQEINSEFSESPLRLQYYVVITGAAYFLFAFFIPTMSAMKNWLGACAVLTFTYIVVVYIVVVKDGKH